MKIEIRRDVIQPLRTMGRMFLAGEFYGYTLEDTDRQLESGGEKIKGKTAIPRGEYKVTNSMSNRFKRIMPEVHNVPGFSGVRIHGGNTEADTEGCPLLGKRRTDIAIGDCAAINADLVRRIDEALARDEVVILTVA